MVPFKCGFLQWERFRISRSPTGGLPCLLSIVIHYPKRDILRIQWLCHKMPKLVCSYLFSLRYLAALYLWWADRQRYSMNTMFSMPWYDVAGPARVYGEAIGNRCQSNGTQVFWNDHGRIHVQLSISQQFQHRIRQCAPAKHFNGWLCKIKTVVRCQNRLNRSTGG